MSGENGALSPAEQLAEAAPPVVTSRMAEELTTTGNLVKNSLVSVFADDAVFAAGQRLLDDLDSMLRSAERQRLLDQ